MNLVDNDAVIVSAARTPIARAFKGALVGERPDDLAVVAVRAALQRAGLEPDIAIDDLIVGCAEPRGEQGHNLARRISVLLGRDDVPGTSVNRFCASSLQGLRMAYHAIRAGEGHVFVVAGSESVSRTAPDTGAEHPLFEGLATRHQKHLEERQWSDPRESSLIPDYYVPMGVTAEFVADSTGITRVEQDEFAAESQRRAAAARETGYFAEEIVPFTLADGTAFDADESLRPSTTADRLAELRPAFSAEGTVTAGNACPLNDGASAMVVMSAKRARELGIVPQAVIRGSAVSALSPEIMGLGPVESSRKVLEAAGLHVDDLDLVEINEAFAAQVLSSMRALELEHSKVNVHGGAIALGHPFGATGIRLVQTLVHGLEERNGRFGLATLCIGGGQGMAMLVERLAN